MSIWNETFIRRLTLAGRHGALVQSESKRPVVLIVEDEYLIRMDAVDTVFFEKQ
jgi:hypothetical protein